MFLESFWFGLLTLLAGACVHRSRIAKAAIDYDLQWMWLFAFLCCGAAAVYLTWPVLGSPLLARIGAHLPQPGTQIHALTVYAAGVIVWVAYQAAIFIASVCLTPLMRVDLACWRRAPHG